mgnify:CR=1 FL=1
MRVILICILFLALLVTCKKSTPITEVDDQPMTISLEVNGEQSHEVRIK